jgi:hypothetical protein
MRKAMFAVAMAAAACSFGCQLTPSPTQIQAVEERAPRGVARVKKRDRLGLAEGSPRWKRSRGAQAKPKRKRNLVTHSRRIRRKHRRARAA